MASTDFFKKNIKLLSGLCRFGGMIPDRNINTQAIIATSLGLSSTFLTAVDLYISLNDSKNKSTATNQQILGLPIESELRPAEDQTKKMTGDLKKADKLREFFLLFFFFSLTADIAAVVLASIDNKKGFLYLRILNSIGFLLPFCTELFSKRYYKKVSDEQGDFFKESFFEKTLNRVGIENLSVSVVKETEPFVNGFQNRPCDDESEKAVFHESHSYI